MKEKQIKVLNLEINIKYKKGMKNIYLRVVEEGKIIVSAPPRTPNYIIENLVKVNVESIKKKVEEMKKKEKFEYKTGSILYILGEKYELNIEKSTENIFVINMDKKTVNMSFLKETTQEEREEYYRQHTRKILLDLVKNYIKNYEPVMNVMCKEVRIKKMKTRWGTCNVTKSRIWINEELIKYPLDCIEHVVVHEMVHLLETNHTKRFYHLVETYYPKHRESEKLLKNYAKKIGFYN